MLSQSYILGQFVATTKIVEITVCMKENHEENFLTDEFLENPKKILCFIQEKMQTTQNMLQALFVEAKRNSILYELNSLMSMIQDNYFEANRVNPYEFQRGYDFQMRCSKFVWV